MGDNHSRFFLGENYQDFRARYLFLRGQSVHWVLGRLVYRSCLLVLSVVLLPVSVVLHALSIRHVRIVQDRIGHLALEPDCVIKECVLGNIAVRRFVITSPAGSAANEFLLDQWKSFFIVVRNPLCCFLITSLSELGLMRLRVSHYARPVGGPHHAFKVFSQWGRRGPILSFPDSDRTRLHEHLGIPLDAWYVCVHHRDGAYLPADEGVQSYRNGSPEGLYRAINLILSKGGWVVRVGDANTKPMAIQHERFLDYAVSPKKSPEIDVLLMAFPRFVLGSTSGITVLASVFGVPCAVANAIPYGGGWFGSGDLVLPKMLEDSRTGRVLTAKEIFSVGMSSYRFSDQYERAGVKVTENSADDIEALAYHMLSSLDPQSVSPSLRTTRFVERFFTANDCGHGSQARYFVDPLIAKGIVMRHELSE
jgi:putative glycosyltransferase (TIGR04372 family)